MSSKKIFILLPDGVGLRNFAFTSFVKTGEQMGWNVIFWNHTPFNLIELGFNEIKLKGKPRPFTDLLKRTKINAELNHFEEKFNDKVYQSYKFPSSNKRFKERIKNAFIRKLTSIYAGEPGLEKLRGKLQDSERKSLFYRNCRETLANEKPDYVFCTNQRSIFAISPLTAAQDLNIPTSTFIFSWDNLPKATLVVKTDHYFVWSDFMKKELLNYYPHIKEEQIAITGSPQFEPHYDLSLRKSRENFFKEQRLDLSKKYICFSGDDITTSPDDPQYLNHVALAVEELNSNGCNLGIIFRRCPVDFSARYDKILEKFKELIFPITPKWEKIGEQWNTILPNKEDLGLQINTILHSEVVVNVGSSMVFDFAILGKPCLYLNYEVADKNQAQWSPKKVYNFVHFRSMPTGEEVYWLMSRKEISIKLEQALKQPNEKSHLAQKWFNRINRKPADRASNRIWQQISQI